MSVPAIRSGTTRIRSVERVHVHLRRLIVNGTYPPGAVLSQVQLARMLGVSRTPLREAMRRLEAEGFIDAEQNRRARVAAIDAESLDVLFTDRILLEAMGIKVTVPRLTEIDLNGILASIAALRIALEEGRAAAQYRARRSTHKLLVAGAGPRLRGTILDQFERCETYRRLHSELSVGLVDSYTAIASGCIARDANDVARRVAQIEVELAQRVLRRVDARYEPVATRVALQMLGGEDYPVYP